MNSMEVLARQQDLVNELENIVYNVVLERNTAARCLTRDFSYEIGLMSSEGIQITRQILKRLKFYGKIENIANNPDAWIAKR